MTLSETLLDNLGDIRRTFRNPLSGEPLRYFRWFYPRQELFVPLAALILNYLLTAFFFLLPGGLLSSRGGALLLEVLCVTSVLGFAAAGLSGAFFAAVGPAKDRLKTQAFELYLAGWPAADIQNLYAASLSAGHFIVMLIHLVLSLLLILCGWYIELDSPQPVHAFSSLGQAISTFLVIFCLSCVGFSSAFLAGLAGLNSKLKQVLPHPDFWDSLELYAIKDGELILVDQHGNPI